MNRETGSAYDSAEQAPATSTIREGMTAEERRVIVASSMGTVFEWYDFFLVGTLATEISRHFFSGVNPTAAYIFTLLSFAAGFVVRPLGAVVFGRLGDIVGRKYTFLVTISLMGAATFVIGLLPGFAVLGIASPIVFVVMRMLQGLALGGEFGGAVTYVAEHAPHHRRAAWTSWVVMTGSLGLVLALAIILALRFALGEVQFLEWGWRVPFLFSIVLLLISVGIRLKLQESPTFRRMKEAGRGSKAPLSEAFGRWPNLRLVLIALVGLAIGQGLTWYTGSFYPMMFMTQVLKADGATVNMLIIIASLLTAPLYYFVARASDRVGRKPIFMIGLALGISCFFPLYKALTAAVNPALDRAQAQSPVVVVADPAECSIQFNPTGTAKFRTSCDIAKSSLASAGVSYATREASAGSIAEIRIGDARVSAYDGSRQDAKEQERIYKDSLAKVLQQAGYAATFDRSRVNWPVAILVLMAMMSFATFTYGAMAASLVEMFPTRIRYTSLSLPYHVGIGWFGGFLPAAAFAIMAETGNIYAGLWYPVILLIVAFIVCLFFLKETKDVDIFKDA